MKIVTILYDEVYHNFNILCDDGINYIFGLIIIDELKNKNSDKYINWNGKRTPIDIETKRDVFSSEMKLMETFVSTMEYDDSEIDYMFTEAMRKSYFVNVPHKIYKEHNTHLICQFDGFTNLKEYKNRCTNGSEYSFKNRSGHLLIEEHKGGSRYRFSKGTYNTHQTCGKADSISLCKDNFYYCIKVLNGRNIIKYEFGNDTHFWRYDTDEINDLEPYFKNIIDIVDNQLYYIKPEISYSRYYSKECDNLGKKSTLLKLNPSGNMRSDIFRTIYITAKSDMVAFDITDEEKDCEERYDLDFSLENIKYINEI